jgi:hypothetical protein
VTCTDEKGIPMSPGRHAPFDRRAAGRFALPARLGAAIAALDDPTVTPAPAASHMRPDDTVIGVQLDGGARAYPLWIVDNYHAINDRIGSDRVLVTSCERCQTGSAFLVTGFGSADRPPLFRATGVLNAVLLMKDMVTGSTWNHYDGMALKGRSDGEELPWVPAYHMEWAHWLALHPETDVLAPPEDPSHPDARHGHGREETFSRPGLDPAFVRTIVGELDRRYPENEMVLGIDGGEEWAAYPLREVQREGGVVPDLIAGSDVVVFAGPRPDGFTMAAFEPRTASRDLTFHRSGGWFHDDETSSRWNVEGLAVAGPMEGERLTPVRSFLLRWHAWVYVHRSTRLFVSERGPCAYASDLPVEAVGGFAQALAALAGLGRDVRIDGPMVSQRRPVGSLESITSFVDGDRLNLHRFGSEAAARDHVGLEGAISTAPFRTLTGEIRARRKGTAVIESDPEIRHADPAQVSPLPEAEIRWAAILDDPGVDGVLEALARNDARPAEPVAFTDVLRGLRAAGYDLVDIGFLPRGQLRVGCQDAVALTIDGDRFLLYRFASDGEAEADAATLGHALAVGTFVLRSTPDTMYLHQLYEIGYAGEDRIRWSPLLEDRRFVGVLASVTRSRAEAGA